MKAVWRARIGVDRLQKLHKKRERKRNKFREVVSGSMTYLTNNTKSSTFQHNLCPACFLIPFRVLMASRRLLCFTVERSRDFRGGQSKLRSEYRSFNRNPSETAWQSHQLCQGHGETRNSPSNNKLGLRK